MCLGTSCINDGISKMNLAELGLRRQPGINNKPCRSCAIVGHGLRRDGEASPSKYSTTPVSTIYTSIPTYSRGIAHFRPLHAATRQVAYLVSPPLFFHEFPAWPIQVLSKIWTTFYLHFGYTNIAIIFIMHKILYEILPIY